MMTTKIAKTSKIGDYGGARPGDFGARGGGGRRGEGDVGRGRAVSLILCNRVGNSTSSYERAE